MKTLSTAQETARLKAGHDIVWIIKASWGGTLGTKYYSLRDDISVDAGVTLDPALETLPNFMRQISLELERSAPPSRIQFTLRNASSNLLRPEAVLEPEDIYGTVIEGYVVFKPASGSISTSDWILVGKYTIDNYQISTTEIVFHCVEYSQSLLQKIVGRIIRQSGASASEFVAPKAPASTFGRMAPIIFGDVEDVPLLPLSSGYKTTLAFSIDAEEMRIYVSSVRNSAGNALVSLSGNIQIDDEIIAYSSISTAADAASGNHFFDVSQRGSNAAEHSEGTIVAEVLAQYDFLIADHAVTQVRNIRLKDGGQIPSSQWSVVAQTYGGLAVYVARFTSLPRRSGFSGIPLIEERGLLAAEWSDVSSNAGNHANAVDRSEESRHISAATIQPSAGQFKVAKQFDTDLSSQSSKFIDAYLEIEYKALPREDSTSETLRWGDPSITIRQNSAIVKTASLGKPGDEEIKGVLDTIEGQELSPDAGTLIDSRELFIPLGGSNKVNATSRVSYIPANSTSPNATVRYWPDFTLNSNINVSVTNEAENQAFVSSSGTAVVNAPNILPSGALRFRATNIAANASDIVTKVTLNISVRADIGFVRGAILFSPAGSSVFYGPPSFTGAGSFGIGNSTFDQFDIDYIPGDYLPSNLLPLTVQDILNGEFAFAHDGGSYNTPTNPPTLASRFRIRAWQLSVNIDPAFVGSQTPLTGTLRNLDHHGLAYGSSRLIQKVSLGSLARQYGSSASGYWDFFDGSFQVEIAEDSAQTHDTQILIFDIRLYTKARETLEQILRDDQVELIADVKGLQGVRVIANGSSVGFMEYPGQFLYHLLTDSRFLGLDGATATDRATLSSLAAVYGQRGFRCARWIDEPQTYEQLISSLCLNMGIRYYHNGTTFKWLGMSLFQIEESVDYALTTNDIFTEVSKAPTPITLLVNQAALYFKRDYDGDRRFLGVVEKNNAAAQDGAVGVLRKTFDLEWIRDPAIASYLGELIIEEYSFPLAVAKFEGPMRLLHLERGDVNTIYDTASGYGIATRARLLAHAFSSPASVSLSILTPRGATHDFEVDSSTYIDVFPARRLMVFVISGQIVAVLRGSSMQIRGGLIEAPNASDVDSGGTDFLQFNSSPILGGKGGAFQFCLARQIPVTTNYNVVMEIYGDGDLRVAKLFEGEGGGLVSAGSEQDTYIWADITPTGAIAFSFDKGVGFTRAGVTNVPDVSLPDFKDRKNGLLFLHDGFAEGVSNFDE